ncbi:hypothetical protein KN10_2370 [Anoxybacillus flavithermus NBRC 109594]|uniref:Uncharacterized protein n=1 Tax=Anoxybacillus flavithermus NBRC 109594 TaxID=1315967 RepID=R4G1X8_9BACL|nr:hypothetical protein KN10_2370 [Anoxybacillus flavithermus NBRC 109594]
MAWLNDKHRTNEKYDPYFFRHFMPSSPFVVSIFILFYHMSYIPK